jgi:hypothetical protein
MVQATCGMRMRDLSTLAVVVMLAGTPVAAMAQSGFDIANVPRPDGAEVVTERSPSQGSITYAYPASVPNTTAATDKSLRAQGWMPYRTPEQEPSSSRGRYKNGRLGIYVHYTMSDGKADRSRIYYSHNNSIPANVPFPEDATEIVYDENRPYLRCVTSLSVEAALEFFNKGLAADGWSQLARSAIETRWPNAKLNDAVENGRRVYFNRDGRESRQPPVMLTLLRGAGDTTVVDLRVPPFALPQDLTNARDSAGLPSPDKIKQAGSTGSADSVRREATALVIADMPVVLAFYRREMTLRGWTEQAGTTINDAGVKASFTQPDGTAVLEMRQRYDLVSVRIVAQLTEAAVAARAKAKKDADAKWMSDALKQAQELTAASEAKRRAQVADAAAAPVESLRAMANPSTPIPLPENADEVKFDGNEGKLDFISPSTPKSVATFYRETLKPLGWKEDRGVINGPTMYSMDFAKGKQELDFTVMLFSGKAKVSVSGTGLQLPADPTKETVKLEAEESQGFPVPKNYTLSSPGTVTMTGSKTAFRREFTGKVPADIGSVLAFYRRELGKRTWKELADGAVVKPDNVMLAFAAPEGPAVLKLGRDDRETTISIVVKNPAEAAKAEALPPAGMGRIVLGNLSEANASVTINQKTIKVPPGVGKDRPPKELMLDLKPGKYRYVLKVPGKRDQNEEITLAADDTWALLIGPGGILPLQMY